MAVPGCLSWEKKVKILQFKRPIPLLNLNMKNTFDLQKVQIMTLFRGLKPNKYISGATSIPVRTLHHVVNVNRDLPVGSPVVSKKSTDRSKKI